MRKFFRAFYFLLTALMIISLSGCDGGDGVNIGDSETDSPDVIYNVKQVAVINSPALEIYGHYKIYVGSELSGLDENERFYVANTGSESSQACLNLGFSTEISSSDSIVIVNSSTNSVVFAYNPLGVEGAWKTEGIVRASGGKLAKYRSLTIAATNEADANHDADILSAETSTSRGTTGIKIGTGGDVDFIEPDEQSYIPRSVNISADYFRLEREVNTFSGIIFKK